MRFAAPEKVQFACYVEIHARLAYEKEGTSAVRIKMGSTEDPSLRQKMEGDPHLYSLTNVQRTPNTEAPILSLYEKIKAVGRVPNDEEEANNRYQRFVNDQVLLLNNAIESYLTHHDFEKNMFLTHLPLGGIYRDLPAPLRERHERSLGGLQRIGGLTPTEAMLLSEPTLRFTRQRSVLLFAYGRLPQFSRGQPIISNLPIVETEAQKVQFSLQAMPKTGPANG